MSKRTDYSKRVELWNVASTRGVPTNRRTIVKAAVRASNGQFHGATNFVVRPNKTIEG